MAICLALWAYRISEQPDISCRKSLRVILTVLCKSFEPSGISLHPRGAT